MRKPVIGITCHRTSPGAPRSALAQSYVEAVLGAGGAAVALPVGLDTDSLASAMEVLDGLLLPGGDDVSPHWYNHDRHPLLGTVDLDRDALEIGAARWALRERLPILGICRGVQLLAVAAGGSLYQDISSQLATAGEHDVREFGFDYLSHAVTVEPGTHLHRALQTTRTAVNSFHHQCVCDVPAGFVISARSDDGIIEGIEAVSHPFAVGVQCHPEGMWRTSAPRFHNLFKAFVHAAERAALAHSA